MCIISAKAKSIKSVILAHKCKCNVPLRSHGYTLSHSIFLQLFFHPHTSIFCFCCYGNSSFSFFEKTSHEHPLGKKNHESEVFSKSWNIYYTPNWGILLKLFPMDAFSMSNILTSRVSFYKQND